MIAPIDYSSGNGFAQGLQLKGLQDEIQQRAMAVEQAQRAAEQQAQFQTEWQASFGDPQKMTALAAKYPGQMELLKAGIGFQNEQHQMALGSAARDLRIAMATGNPQAVQSAALKNAGVLGTVGSSPEEIVQQFQQDPQSLAHTVDAVGLSALGAKDYYGVENDRAQRQNDRAKLAEQIRNNDMQNAATIRGQNISAQNARLASSGETSDMKNFNAYSRLLKTDPEAAALFAQVAGIKTEGADNRQVQLSDGRTVSIKGKLHGAGQNAFYEATDNAGNTIRVPPSAIAATASSGANAQNYAMKKDIDMISQANPESLDFLTGVTGGTGKPALGADVRSRIGSKEQRQIYNAAQRIQGKMQNQGIAAARDMGASGINTVAEAKMYFQGMPQVDFSSPEAVQQSVNDIKSYTDNYNQQYNVNVGSGRQSAAPQPAQQTTGVHTSKSGIQFTVK
ncbi:DNA transfer protein [Yokenella regensburgei]|uniref:phage DNA ejection protein n=1 Tax=Yokenella regensburgei TaxID=158877 RepID=UPI003F15FFAA